MFKTTIASIICTILFFSSILGQSIKVQPFLQDVEPISVIIKWETTSGEESLVEWGLTETLGSVTTGIAYPSEGEARIHEVKIEGLTRFTSYYYRVSTGEASSEIYKFKTAPFPNQEESFRIVAMSDMQKDGSNPNKFLEIVQDGILDYLNDTEEELSDNLALVMIPGDLVVTGSNFSQWEEHFFAPSEGLFSRVPVYPVLGNHEQNSTYYFQYFSLPENGSDGFEEHWWFKDYGNVRIIGLNSNSPFNNQTQLDWLNELLNSTCSNEDIDFVFAQLHHPFKSELWLPGESNYTGSVVEQLEQFSSSCGKPSIHFFGHTHGYSRGQSRDHKHLWINVATAGGAIDHWGDFPQFDYDEFEVSQAEWGFVSVEVIAGNEPRFTIKRISRGDEEIARDNEITDSLVIEKAKRELNQPSGIFPIDIAVQPECVELKAEQFNASSLGQELGEVHWQVARDCYEFDDIVFESWKHYQNQYFKEDTQVNDDLTNEEVLGLEENSNYCWRVRFRDRELNWSEWSDPNPFSTTESMDITNWLINPGAEDDLFGWTILEGVAEALTDGECDGISPHSGVKYFAVGGVCTDGAYGVCVQDVNLAGLSTDIDAGDYPVSFGGFLSNWGGSDLPAMKLIYLDGSGMALDSSSSLMTLNSSWTMFNENEIIPVGTRTIRFQLTGTRNAGNDNDSYFDGLFLYPGLIASDCDMFVSDNILDIKEQNTISIKPNPAYDIVIIKTEDFSKSNHELILMNAYGEQLSVQYENHGSHIVLQVQNLLSGNYYIQLRGKEGLIAHSRFLKI